MEYYYSSVRELFTPPRIKIESGIGIVDPIIFGDGENGFNFNGDFYVRTTKETNNNQENY